VAFSPDGHWLATTGKGLSILKVNERTGRLRKVGHLGSFPTPAGPFNVTFSPDGRLLAVTDTDDNNSYLWMFAFNRTTGALRQAALLKLIDVDFTSLAFSPDGGLLVGAQAGIRIFAVNRRTGALREVPGSPHSTGDTDPHSARFSAHGNRLVVVRGDDVLIFTVNVRTGRLRKVSTWRDTADNSGVDGPGNASSSPNGRFVAVSLPDSLAMFRVDPRSAALHEVAHSPLSSEPYAPVAFSRDGRLLATTSSVGAVTDSVAIVSVDETTGRMQSVAGSPLPSEGYTDDIAFDPNGRFLAAATQNDYRHQHVSMFSLPACSDPDHDSDCD
jgi:6-phosphogluconolactonase (cycloisomerase 2 family)